MSAIHDSGPGEFAHTSTTYVWHTPDFDLGVHLVPDGLNDKTLPLGPVTRAVYHTLETADAVDPTRCFVVLHYVLTTQELHVTMLPVGDEDRRRGLDEQIKTGLTELLVTLKESVGGRPDGVTILFNDVADLQNSGDIAIVHELGLTARVSAMQQFTSTILTA